MTTLSPVDQSGRGLEGVTVWVVLLSLVLLVPSALVGYLTAPAGEAFEWSHASSFGTALGTVLLAGVTVSLARTAQADVREVRRMAAENRRPVVVILGKPTLRVEASAAIVRVVLANVGRGPAVRVRVRGDYSGAFAEQITVQHATLAAILPNTEASCELALECPARVREQLDQGQVDRGISVSGDYLDAAHDPEGKIVDATTIS